MLKAACYKALTLVQCSLLQTLLTLPVQLVNLVGPELA